MCRKTPGFFFLNVRLVWTILVIFNVLGPAKEGVEDGPLPEGPTEWRGGGLPRRKQQHALCRLLTFVCKQFVVDLTVAYNRVGYVIFGEKSRYICDSKVALFGLVHFTD